MAEFIGNVQLHKENENAFKRKQLGCPSKLGFSLGFSLSNYIFWYCYWFSWKVRLSSQLTKDPTQKNNAHTHRKKEGARKANNKLRSLHKNSKAHTLTHTHTLTHRQRDTDTRRQCHPNCEVKFREIQIQVSGKDDDEAGKSNSWRHISPELAIKQKLQLCFGQRRRRRHRSSNGRQKRNSGQNSNPDACPLCQEFFIFVCCVCVSFYACVWKTLTICTGTANFFERKLIELSHIVIYTKWRFRRHSNFPSNFTTHIVVECEWVWFTYTCICNICPCQIHTHLHTYKCM